MQAVTPLTPGHYYHIYNRGNNGENLFREERNYRYFLQLYIQHVLPIADTFAYCLLRNHFHLFVRLKETSQVTQTSQVSETCEVSPKPSQHFSNLFNAYTKAINKAYGRTGSLFQDRFGRIEVTTDTYLTNLIYYIHHNPQKHGLIDDFREWTWSSYAAMLSSQPTHMSRPLVLDWFGGAQKFTAYHREALAERVIWPLVGDDLD